MASVTFYISLFYMLGLVRGTNFLDFKGNLPDPLLISKFLNDFVRPIINLSSENPVFRSYPYSEETEVEKVIREKIRQLEPLLQDNEKTSDKDDLLLEGNDETTIIEFLPKTEERKTKSDESSVFKGYVKKYKKLREKINKALIKESVSEKTKHLVTKTLDELINSAVQSQCKWKRNLRAQRKGESSVIAAKWNRGLHELKKVLFSFVDNGSSNLRRNKSVTRLMDAFQILFRSFTDDIDIISKKYKILCDFVPKDQPSVMNFAERNISALRNSWDKSDLEEDRCYSVVICSSELGEFLRNFYYALNDTTVSVVNNYVEMYTRDVAVDNENEKHVIIALLNKISKDLNNTINKVFIKDLNNLYLDKDKNRDANIKALSDYVKSSVENIKAEGKQIIKSELLILREKILTIIMDDLNVNLDVDLGNLERDFVRKICNIFRLCNGRYAGRRQGSINTRMNKVYVEVKLTLDDGNITDLKSYKNIFNNHVTVRNQNSTLRRFNIVNRNLTVTRTTHVYNVKRIY